VTARRFKELGAAAPGTEIPELGPVERAARKLQAPALAAGGGDEEEGAPCDRG
jgi:hypothetical protein